MTAKLRLSAILFLCFSLFCACAKKDDLAGIQKYARKSEVYYQSAVTKYKELISQKKDAERAYFELGKLYYEHGEFPGAIEAFKKLNTEPAKKFLAISYYRAGDFTAALEIFNRNDIPDDEYLYYYGLTCEKLNLFDRALEHYGKIHSPDFASLAIARVDQIERQAKGNFIKDVDPRVAEILAAAPTAKDYPQAGALGLWCDEKIEVTGENTQISDLHYIIKILNERGKEAFAESVIEYDSTFEKVELEYARTIKPDGQVVEVGKRHIRDVSKYLNFPLYSNVRAYIISFPEVTEGVCIEYKVKISRSQLINEKDIVLDYSVQQSEPIILARFVLSVPKENPAHIKIINEKYNDFGAKLNPQTEERQGRLIYTWQFKDIPQIIYEPSMPAWSKINPTILISTFDDWQEVYSWWDALAKDKVKPDEAIKRQVEKLTGEQVSSEEKLRAIYNFCAQKIRYVAVEYGKGGYEPHNAVDILKFKYGDCKDQAVLLVTMLRQAGFRAWLVLIPTQGNYDLNKDFPAIFFNHAIAAVALKDRIVFLDPTAETCPFGDLPSMDQGRGVLIYKEEGYEIGRTPLFAAQHNLVSQRTNIKVKSDESITAARDIISTGIYDQSQRSWLLYTQPKLIEQSLQSKIQGFSIGAKLEKYHIENLDNLNTPVYLSYSFQGPEYFTSAGNLRVMPQLASFDEIYLVAKDKRKYAIDFSILDAKESILTVEIPPNFVVKYLPQSIVKDSPWLKCMVEYYIKDNRISFKQWTELKKTEVTANEYSDFKSLLEDLAKKAKERVVLERIN
jgi:tetratricopeptide (TPR) repeat protein